MLQPPPAATHRHHGPMSDQDLLNRVQSEKYALLPHTVVRLNDRGLTTTFAPEAMHMANVKKLQDMPQAIEHFAMQFTAVHFSMLGNVIRAIEWEPRI